MHTMGCQGFLETGGGIFQISKILTNPSGLYSKVDPPHKCPLLPTDSRVPSHQSNFFVFHLQVKFTNDDQSDDVVAIPHEYENYLKAIIHNDTTYLSQLIHQDTPEVFHQYIRQGYNHHRSEQFVQIRPWITIQVLLLLT